MASIAHGGYEPTTERQLYFLELDDPGDIAAVADFPAPHFVCFIAWDARNASTNAVALFIKHLLGAGAAYVSSWGPDCQRVHDITDETRSSLGARDRADSVVMTTWHENESLDHALWSFLFNTFPEDSFEQTTRSALAVIVGNPDWAALIREGLRDPSALSARVLANETRNV
jgi:hypothetical protein